MPCQGGRNMKSSRNKSNSTFPQIWWSESATLQLWGRFQTLCDEPKWFFLAPQPFQCTWEGSSFISYKFGAQQVTLFGLYFFCITSQGVAALVSESETNPNNNLMMRRGALSSYNWWQKESLLLFLLSCSSYFPVCRLLCVCLHLCFKATFLSA